MENTLNIKVPAIKGLLPAVDRRIIKTPFVIDGKNFLLDFEGPYSGFGYTFLSQVKLTDFDNFATLRIDNDTLLFTEQGVFSYDKTSDRYFPQFVFDSSAGAGPWTRARVGNKYYFARKNIGVIQFDPVAKAWQTVASAFFPQNIQAITQAAGRLVVLGTDKVAWSAQDNGVDMTPSLETGAGFQGLSLIGGTPLGVKQVASGFISFTTEGILKSEITDTRGIFRHFPLTVKHKAINPYCIVENDDQEVVFLDKKGLFITDGVGVPKAYQELFSEFLSRELLRSLNLADEARIRLFYQSERKLLFLSYSQTSNPLLLDRTYVLYIPRNEWGVFNDTVHGFGDVSLSSDAEFGYNFGFINPDGYFCVFSGPAFRQVAPVDRTYLYHFHSTVDFPARQESGVWKFPSIVHITPISEFPFVSSNSALYKYINSEATPYTTDTTGLDSYIIVGPFRWEDMEYPDEMGICTNLSIGMEQSGSSTDEDYMLISDVSEDWNSITGDEDWGFGIQAGNAYVAELIGSNDGLHEFQSEILSEISQQFDTKFFAGYVTGLYFLLKISATESSESYHLKSLELGGTVGGRL